MEISISKKRLKIIIYVVLGVGILLLLQSFLTTNTATNNSTDNTASTNTSVDKVQVVHFHGHQQCWSCVTVGEFAKKTIEEYLTNELATGKIEFLDINAEISSNSAIVNKFKATGSSLFVNVIRDGKDNISQDVTVWRLIDNENEFKQYFGSKLKAYF